MNKIILSEEARDRRFFIGRPFNINYDKACVLTSDNWKQEAGGLPRGCFLLAFYRGSGLRKDDQEPTEALLLRALAPIGLPNGDNNVASMIDYYKEHHHEDESGQAQQLEKHLDPYTRFEFGFSGIECRVLGSFYRANGHVEFGADVENFFAANNYEVYKATGQVLEMIVNQRDERIANDQSELKIGTVRYSSTRRLQSNGDQEKEVPVSISANNFLGKRTALFGMTRTGKSNTVKKIIEATTNISHQAPSQIKSDQNPIQPPTTDNGLPSFPVGQIVFDINGEYANENLQDDGTAIYKMYQDDTVRYSCIKKNGFKEMKVNFYRELQAGFGLIKDSLAEDSSDYTKSLMTIDFSPPPDNDYSKKTTYERLVAAYHCCLYRAGFAAPADMTALKFSGNEQINAIVNCDPREGVSFEQAVNWFETCWEQSHSSLQGKEDLKAMLVFLTRRRSPGREPSVSGYIKIRDSELKNSHTSEGESIGFPKQIDSYLRAGKIVIVDLSEGMPSIQKNFSEKICQGVFNSSINNFTNRRNNNFIQFYFEEAHNLFPRAEDRDLNQIYNRLAKEGAKLNIGLVYATQEVSSLSKNILKNTQNWFIAHLNNRDEIKELQKYYDFEDFTDSLIRFSAKIDKGFARMKTYTNPFVVPIQIDRFVVTKPKEKPQPIEAMAPQIDPQLNRRKNFNDYGVFQPAR